jgi:hypothetical protein
VQNPQNTPTLILNTGEFDPLIGRSYFEIAMEGRSQHKSQEMGVLELRGRQTSGMRLVESVPARVEQETSVFDGLDTSLKGIGALTGDTSKTLADKLDDLEETAREALAKYEPFAPQKLIPILAKGRRQAREAAAVATNAEAKELLEEKADEFGEALRMAAGVVVDALSDSETLVAGESAIVGVRVFAPEKTEAKVKNLSLKVPGGWRSNLVPPPAQPESGFRPRNENAFGVSFFEVAARADAAPTEPYWLDTPRRHFNFEWEASDAKNMPFQPALMSAEAVLDIGGEEIVVRRDVQYRYADDIRGELRRGVSVVPKVSVALDSNLIVAPVAARPTRQRVVVSLTNNSNAASKGAVRFELPNGWTATPATAAFDLRKRGEKTAVSFDLTIPANAKTGDYRLVANAEIDGKTFNRTMQTIAYPHMQTHRRYTSAEIAAKVLDLKVAPVRVGYIMGSGDTVPEAIRRLGLDVTMLGEKDLSTGDLSRFDTIVVGIRASQTRPDFVANNNRLLDFVRAGGTLIVQYQQNEFVRENLLPYPAKMEAVINGTQRISNLRATDENAPVKILAPAHPVFNFPNKITERDFENWIQERHLYSLSSLDAQYTPLLESHDEGEPEINGGMVYARLGKGNYVYNSYSFFRQLPTGNPGAYRIFANLLSLPKAR